MDKSIVPSVVAIALGIVGIAALSVFVGRGSNTTGVISAGGSSFASALRCAMSPIIGGGNCGSTSLPFGTSSSTISFGSPVL